MTMKVGMKILAAAMLPLGLAACGSKPAPRVDEAAYVETMIRCLHDEDARTRFEAVRALGRLRGPAAQKALLQVRCMVHDVDLRVREEAARSLQKLDPSCGELVLADR